MRCIADNRHQAPRGRTPCTASCVYCCCQCWKQTRETRVTRVGILGNPFIWLSDLGWQRQATSKVSIDILVRFPLASSAGRSVHTVGLHAGRHAPQKSGLPTRRTVHTSLKSVQASQPTACPGRLDHRPVPTPCAPANGRPGFPFGFLGAGGRLPKARRGWGLIA